MEKNPKLKEVYDTIPNNAKYTSWKLKNEMKGNMKQMFAKSVVDDVKNANAKW